MKPVLEQKWIAEIFKRLLGIYGMQFKNKFSSIENGVDVGFLAAKDIWAQELGFYCSHPECIAWALDNLPTDHAPNAIEFKELCRRAPRKQLHKALEHKEVKADPARVAEFTEEAQKVFSTEKNHRAWVWKLLERKARGEPVDDYAYKCALELSK